MSKKEIHTQFPSKIFYENFKSQKEKERRLLDSFLRCLQLRNASLIPRDIEECPDFLLVFSENDYEVKVGFEITEYYTNSGQRGSPQRKFVEKWKQFARSLQVRLEQENLFFYGAVFFVQPDYDIFKRINKQSFIDEIVELLQSLNLGDIAHLDSFDKNKFPLLAKHVQFINVRNTSPEKGVLWWPAHLQTGEVPNSQESLIEIVKSKNEKAHNYDWQNATEKWLLIFCAGNGLLDMATNIPDPKILENVGLLHFTRIYLWDRFSHEINEIYPNFHNVFSSKPGNILYKRNYPKAVRPFVG